MISEKKRREIAFSQKKRGFLFLKFLKGLGSRFPGSGGRNLTLFTRGENTQPVFPPGIFPFFPEGTKS